MSESKTVFSSHVQLLEIVSQGQCDDKGVLQLGCLLQWMDIAACLAAERHAKHNAVTLAMDDLNVDSTLRAGDVVRIEGQVNAAFGTSMEVGVTVQAESADAAGERAVVSACFIFVALDADGKKIKVEPIAPQSVEEKHAYQLAQERRALRSKKKELEAEAAAEAH